MKKPMPEMAPPKKSILIRIDEDLKVKIAVKLAKSKGVKLAKSKGDSFQSICEKALRDYVN